MYTHTMSSTKGNIADKLVLGVYRFIQNVVLCCAVGHQLTGDSFVVLRSNVLGTR